MEHTNWPMIVVLVCLAGYVVSEMVGRKTIEGFNTPIRSDIGYASDGWKEDGAYTRDLRYKEAFVDLQGIGIATDFCRAVYKKNDPDSLRVSCALGRRDGMDTMEYNTITKRDGFRFSRDDYWRRSTVSGRMDYCRILKTDTGEWLPVCAIAGRDGFKRKEEFDSSPPAAIQTLLEAYEGIVVWFRWQDDRIDYAGNAAFTVHGSPVFPALLKPDVTRGLQLNRSAAEPLRDYLRWGEMGTYELHQAIQPRQIRAIACWIWWDGFEQGATILECSNPSTATSLKGRKDRIALGIEGGGPELPPIPYRSAAPAQELRPDIIQAIGQLTEPASDCNVNQIRTLTEPLQNLVDIHRIAKHHQSLSNTATYFFEIWDDEQRLMRLTAPMSSAKAGVWQHVVVTVTDASAWWPTWQLWLDGTMVAEKSDGRLPPTMELRDNYIGKNVRGCIQDFRMYNTPMPESKIASAIAWSKPKLHPSP